MAFVHTQYVPSVSFLQIQSRTRVPHKVFKWASLQKISNNRRLLICSIEVPPIVSTTKTPIPTYGNKDEAFLSATKDSNRGRML